MPLLHLCLLIACAAPSPDAGTSATPEPPASASEASPAPGAPGGPATEAPLPDPFVEVRALLAPARREAKSDEERDALLATWEKAYRDVFEPRVEVPLRGRVASLTECEYAWGRVLVAVRDHDQRALDRAFTDWDAAMAALETEGRPLLPPSAAPPPPAGAPAPSAYGPPSTVRPEGTPPAAVPAKPRVSGGG